MRKIFVRSQTNKKKLSDCEKLGEKVTKIGTNVKKNGTKRCPTWQTHTMRKRTLSDLKNKYKTTWSITPDAVGLGKIKVA